MDQPQKQSTRQKRTKMQVEADRVEIARLHIQGKTHWEIAQIITEGRGYTLTKQQIQYDVSVIKKEWRESRNVAIDEKKAEELARLDAVEQEAWKAYLASCQDAEYQKQIITTDREGKARPIRVEKGTTKRTGDFHYLDVIRGCVEQRAKILGINAPEKFARTNKEGTEDIPPLSEEERQAEIGALLGLARERAAKGHPSPAGDTNDE